MFSLYRGANKTAPKAPTLVGLSTDTKPSTTLDGSYLTNGATFKEIDTGDVYRWDEVNHIWYEGSEQ